MQYPFQALSPLRIKVRALHHPQPKDRVLLHVLTDGTVRPIELPYLAASRPLFKVFWLSHVFVRIVFATTSIITNIKPISQCHRYSCCRIVNYLLKVIDTLEL